MEKDDCQLYAYQINAQFFGNDQYCGLAIAGTCAAVSGGWIAGFETIFGSPSSAGFNVSECTYPGLLSTIGNVPGSNLDQYAGEGPLMPVMLAYVDKPAFKSKVLAQILHIRELGL